jgi:Fibronectin type III domain/Putative Ig domain/Carboxypeptidase regulatory-like domain
MGHFAKQRSKQSFLLVLILSILCTICTALNPPLAKAASASIVGTVSDAGGNGIAGVSVTATVPGGVTVQSGPVLTSSGGAYELDLPTGTYDVHFDPPNGSSFQPVIADNVVVTADQVLNIQLVNIMHTFSGTIRDQDGNPIAVQGINVNLYDAAGNFVATTQTDSAGRYSVSAAPGAYRVAISGYAGDPIPGTSGFDAGLSSSSVDLSGGDASRDIQLPLARLHVTVEDPSGKPVPGAQVSANSGGAISFFAGDPQTTSISTHVTAVTDGAGTVNLPAIQGERFGLTNPDSDNICASLPGQQPVCLTAPLTITGDTTLIFRPQPTTAGPSAPTAARAVAGPGQATVSWSPPSSDGGSPVTSYTVTATDTTNPASGGQTATGSASPLTVTGLTGGDSYTFTVTARNANGTSAPSEPSDVVTIQQQTTITSAASTTAEMRAPFDFTVTTTGIPIAAITETGTMPAGVTLTDNHDGTAELTGTPTAGSAGSYPITIIAANGVGSPASQSFTLTVTSATYPPAFTSDSADAETFDVPFSFTVNTTGYPAPKLTKAGALPSGVTFTDNHDGTATIAGTPSKTAIGAYTLTFTAKSAAGTATQRFALTVTKAPIIKNIPTTTAHAGKPLSLTITAKGNTTPVLAEPGPLPSGLSFTDNGNGTATIAGTPEAGSGGSYSITVTATNQLGTASQTFTLKVNEAPAISSAARTTAVTGTAFTFHVITTGFPAPKITRAGSLPSGVTFTAATETFSGTPKPGTAGSYPIAITAKNSSGYVTQNFLLVVS